MKKTISGIFTSVLCAVLILSLMPQSAYADEMSDSLIEDTAYEEYVSVDNEPEVLESAPAGESAEPEEPAAEEPAPADEQPEPEEPAAEEPALSDEQPEPEEPAPADELADEPDEPEEPLMAGNLYINAANFPSEELRTVISNAFDKDSSGYLDPTELANAAVLDAKPSVTGVSLNDLTGLDKLTYLTKIDLTNNNQLTSIDLSLNTALKTLTCGSSISNLVSVKAGPALTELHIKYANISTLDVRSYPNLEKLALESTQTSSIHLGCPKLKELTAYSCGLTSLNVSSCPELTYLNVHGNSIGSLDLTNNTALEKIYADENSLTSLILPSGTMNALNTLNCSNNLLESLTIPDCPSMDNINCGSNHLSSLTIGLCPKTRYFRCNDNQLNSLNLSAFFDSRLESAEVQNNNLTELSMTLCRNLRMLNCSGNYLSKVEIVNNPYLIKTFTGNTPTESDGRLTYGSGIRLLIIDKNNMEHVDCGVPVGSTYFPDEIFRDYVSYKYDKDSTGFLSYDDRYSVTQMDVSGKGIQNLDGVGVFPNLKGLNCSNNQISSLNLALLEQLEILNCSENPIASITWSSGTHQGPKTTLQKLYCSETELASLNLNGFGALEILDCSYGSISELNVSTCANLTSLTCNNNCLSSLSVSVNTKLDTLDCSMNEISSLFLSNNKALKTINCQNNWLSALVLPKSSKLESLNCGFNELEELDPSYNTELKYLVCQLSGIESLNVSNCTKIKNALMNGTRTISGKYGSYIYKTGSGDNVITLIIDPGTMTTPDPMNLTAPVITSLSNTADGITIKWNKVEYAKKYWILYREAAADSYSKLIKVSGNSYTFDTPEDGAKYFFYVRCTTNDGTEYTSARSAIKSIIRLGKASITSRKNVSGGVQIKWSAVAGASKYNVLRKSGSGSYELVATTKLLKYTDKTVKSGTKYYWKVQAANGKHTGVRSDPKVIKYLAQPVISSAAASSGKNTLKWGKVTGAAKYRIYRKRPGSTKWTDIAETTSLKYNDKNVKKGKTYKYRIQAIDSTGKYSSYYSASSKWIKAK